jgi:hypothetical protein
MELDDVARRVDVVGTTLTEAGTRLAATHVAATGLCAAAPGGLGELGRALHEQAAIALSARSAEAGALGAAASALASSVASALAGYRETESRRGGS